MRAASPFSAASAMVLGAIMPPVVGDLRLRDDGAAATGVGDAAVEASGGVVLVFVEGSGEEGGMEGGGGEGQVGDDVLWCEDAEGVGEVVDEFCGEGCEDVRHCGRGVWEGCGVWWTRRAGWRRLRAAERLRLGGAATQ